MRHQVRHRRASQLVGIWLVQLTFSCRATRGGLWSARTRSMALYSPDAIPRPQSVLLAPCTAIPPRGLEHAPFRSIIWLCLATSSTAGVGTDVRYLRYGWS